MESGGKQNAGGKNEHILNFRIIVRTEVRVRGGIIKPG